jgi:hypothetical protein
MRLRSLSVALMLLAGILTAEVMTGSAVLRLRSAAKNFSTIDTVACRVSGPVCGLGWTWICRPLRGCWCARCCRH